MDLAYLADFSNLPLVPACYDHHCVARLDMHGYPNRLSILVEVIRLPLLPWALDKHAVSLAP